MVQNILGHGIDIPLLGLREASREVTGELHELFTDESYQISQCFLLSTSQVLKFILFIIFRLIIALKHQRALLSQMHVNCTIQLMRKNLWNICILKSKRKKKRFSRREDNSIT